MSLQSINSLHFKVSEIQPGQTFSRRTHPPAHTDTMGENNTPAALKRCEVKTNHGTFHHTGNEICKNEINRAANEPENAPRFLVLEEPTWTRLIA